MGRRLKKVRKPEDAKSSSTSTLDTITSFGNPTTPQVKEQSLRTTKLKLIPKPKCFCNVEKAVWGVYGLKARHERQKPKDAMPPPTASLDASQAQVKVVERIVTKTNQEATTSYGSATTPHVKEQSQRTTKRQCFPKRKCVPAPSPAAPDQSIGEQSSGVEQMDTELHSNVRADSPTAPVHFACQQNPGVEREDSVEEGICNDSNDVSDSTSEEELTLDDLLLRIFDDDWVDIPCDCLTSDDCDHN